MRTDVKVGLICVFVLLIGFVAYFALTSKANHNQLGDMPGNAAPPLAPATPGGTVGSGLIIAPEPAAPSSSGSVLGPSAAYGAPMISPPATAPGTLVTITPPGSGGRPLSVGTTGPATMGSPVHSMGPSSLIIEVPTTTTAPSGFGPGTMPSHIISDPMPGTSSEYVIKKGDNFSTIAKANHTTVKALQAANPGVDSTKLKINQKIKLPSGTDSTTPPPTTRPHSGLTTTAPSAAGTYVVQPGDNLQKIAKAKYGDASKWKVIFKANSSSLDDANSLKVGMTLKIPAQ